MLQAHKQFLGLGLILFAELKMTLTEVRPLIVTKSGLFVLQRFYRNFST